MTIAARMAAALMFAALGFAATLPASASTACPREAWSACVVEHAASTAISAEAAAMGDLGRQVVATLMAMTGDDGWSDMYPHAPRGVADPAEMRRALELATLASRGDILRAQGMARGESGVVKAAVADAAVRRSLRDGELRWAESMVDLTDDGAKRSQLLTLVALAHLRAGTPGEAVRISRIGIAERDLATLAGAFAATGDPAATLRAEEIRATLPPAALTHVALGHAELGDVEGAHRAIAAAAAAAGLPDVPRETQVEAFPFVFVTAYVRQGHLEAALNLAMLQRDPRVKINALAAALLAHQSD